MLPRFLVACDTFKGSVTSPQACAAIQRGLERALQEHATAVPLHIVTCPISDGGAGLLDALCHTVPSMRRQRVVKRIVGPLGNTLDGADYAINVATRDVVVEMAQAAGLPLVPEDQRNPLLTTSYGVGQLMLEALADAERTPMVVPKDGGVSCPQADASTAWRMYLGIGGSSTNDGGLGALQAMGLDVFLGGSSTPVQRPIVGRDLRHITRLAPTPAFEALRERLRGRLVLICDVDNPFTGPHGATRVYGPQKGATTEAMLSELEDGMCHLAGLIASSSGLGGASSIDLCHLPGAGGAGGMSGTMAALLDVEWRCGADVVAEIVNLPRLVEDADIIVTGEGSFDRQTLRHQKTVSKLAQLVVRTNHRTIAQGRSPRRVVVVCGRTDLHDTEGSVGAAAHGGDSEALSDVNLVMAVVSHVVPLSPSPFSANEAMQRGAECIEAVVANCAASWLTCGANMVQLRNSV